MIEIIVDVIKYSEFHFIYRMTLLDGEVTSIIEYKNCCLHMYIKFIYIHIYDKSKTLIMFNDKVPPQAIKIDGKDLEQVDEYIYLGQLIKLKKDYDSEMKRRIKTFGKNRDILKSKMPLCLKCKIFQP